MIDFETDDEFSMEDFCEEELMVIGDAYMVINQANAEA